MNCGHFERGIHHFQADELPESERLQFQDHLDGCSDCARRLEVEDGFLRAVRARLQPTPAPPGLETRIRARLAQAGRPRTVAWYRRPWAAVLAASVLLAILIFPGVESLSGYVLVSGHEATIVDHECDRMGKTLAQQRKCKRINHSNVLKIAGGTYWHLNHGDPAGRARLLDPDMRGHRLVVEGQLYPDIRTLHLESFEDLGLRSL